MDKSGMCGKSEQFVLEAIGITKEFPGVVANDNITLQLKRGEIHALLGENGAGKSTLMSVLFGLYQPERGSILVRGKTVHIKSPLDANALGIGMVHQHFKLVQNFSVLQNIVLGMETVRHGVLQMEEARKRVQELSACYGLAVEPDAIIENITVGMQQRVEILKMLYRDNDIMIFDEPTAVLTPQETSQLIEIMKKLAAEGKSILFITHKLKEIKAAAHRCTVLRRGRLVGTVEVGETTQEELSQMMVGRAVNLKLPKPPVKTGKEALEVKGLWAGAVRDVSFVVHTGEIVSIAGIDGNGQTELVQAITGLMAVSRGEVCLGGENVTGQTIRYRNTHGLSHIPEDRQRYGLVLDYSLGFNLILQQYFEPDFKRRGFLKHESVLRYASGLIDSFDIRCGDGARTIVRNMSGGNQQKAIAAREISRNHQILLAVQPTRGLDVGAIEYIHRELLAQRESGKAVLLVSLELDEILALSDRILVMYEGSVVAELKPEETDEGELGLFMAGAKRQGVEA